MPNAANRMLAVTRPSIAGTPGRVLGRYAAAECPEAETDPVAIAASTLTPLYASQLRRLIEHARAGPGDSPGFACAPAARTGPLDSWRDLGGSRQSRELLS
jgi:hypothetical protein